MPQFTHLVMSIIMPAVILGLNYVLCIRLKTKYSLIACHKVLVQTVLTVIISGYSEAPLNSMLDKINENMNTY